jgi:hypothetical protein
MKLLMIVSALVVSSGVRAQTNPGIFDSVLPALRQKTRVPLKLPSYLATENETNPLYAIAVTVALKRYELQLAFTPDCTGGNVCRYGMVSGEVIAFGENRARGKPAKLARGITGYFVDAKCGANCSDSTLTWQQGGYRYVVGIKAANLDTLRKVANSAIVNRKVTP